MSSECKAMTRHPLAPELWEQALMNGRIVHPSDDEAVAQYADEWYRAQGGLFASASEPEPVEEPQKEPEGEGEAEEPQEHAPEHVTEQVTAQEPAAEEHQESEHKPEAPRRRPLARTRQGKPHDEA